MNHTNTTDNIRINTSSAADLHVVATYQLKGQIEQKNDYTAITSATDTNISFADSGECRIINLSFKNAHASTSNTIKVSKYNGSTAFEIIQATLAAGESLVFDGNGWRAFTASGKLKVEVGSGGGSGDMLAATYDPANISEQLVGLTATQTLTNKTLTAPTINTTANITDSTNKRFVSDAQEAKIDYLTVTQAVDLDAIETRVNALDAAVVLKGTWDASAGTFPGGGTAQAGDSWIVSVGGTIDSVVFTANDRIIAILDNASTGTFAANWFKADYTDLVSSLDGSTGALTLGAIINGLTGKTTPVDADTLALSDSEAANASKKLTWENLKLTIASYYNALTATLTNKRITERVSSETSSATPTINTDNVDCHSITALATAITSMTTNLSGTPTNFQKLIIRIKDNGTARAITWGASFEARGVALPTTTVISKVLTVGFIYDTVSAKWGCVASAQEA